MVTFLKALLGILLAVAITLGLLAVLGVLFGLCSLRRSIAIASKSSCPSCGNPAGKEAVVAAKEAWSRRAPDLIRQHAGPEFRLVAEWEIHCPHCRHVFYFLPEKRTVEAQSDFADHPP